MNHSETGILKMATSAAPCGHCRQFLNEIDTEGRLEILMPNHPPEKLSFFLPEAFGPKDLGLWIDPWNSQGKNLEPSSIIAKAIDAATASHAPYSQSKSGVAIQTIDGKVYTGAYVENAAFNPSLSPFHVALAGLVSDLCSYDEISRVILVEQESAKISHEGSIRAMLDRIAPQAQFHREIVL